MSVNEVDIRAFFELSFPFSILTWKVLETIYIGSNGSKFDIKKSYIRLADRDCMFDLNFVSL